jgi:ribosome-associated protein
MIDINEDLRIPDNEIEYTFSPSSKPGGQHVNKVSSRVTLIFDVAGSPTLSDDQRRRIRVRLQGRITKDGMLRVVSQRYRSQRANRDEARDRFAELLREALKRRRPRKQTTVPGEVRERRLREKKRRARIKEGRARVSEGDD